jgi:NAD(P)-dependent dehydrogenase (short-subunit alcohol dehydrogenase family)
MVWGRRDGRREGNATEIVRGAGRNELAKARKECQPHDASDLPSAFLHLLITGASTHALRGRLEKLAGALDGLVNCGGGGAKFAWSG